MAATAERQLRPRHERSSPARRERTPVLTAGPAEPPESAASSAETRACPVRAATRAPLAMRSQVILARERPPMLSAGPAVLPNNVYVIYIPDGGPGGGASAEQQRYIPWLGRRDIVRDSNGRRGRRGRQRRRQATRAPSSTATSNGSGIASSYASADGGASVLWRQAGDASATSNAISSAFWQRFIVRRCYWWGRAYLDFGLDNGGGDATAIANASAVGGGTAIAKANATAGGDGVFVFWAPRMRRRTPRPQRARWLKRCPLSSGTAAGSVHGQDQFCRRERAVDGYGPPVDQSAPHLPRRPTRSRKAVAPVRPSSTLARPLTPSRPRFPIRPTPRR